MVLTERLQMNAHVAAYKLLAHCLIHGRALENNVCVECVRPGDHDAHVQAWEHHMFDLDQLNEDLFPPVYPQPEDFLDEQLHDDHVTT